jgi:hypothetical protein
MLRIKKLILLMIHVKISCIPSNKLIFEFIKIIQG